MFGQFVVHLDYMLSAPTARRPAPCGQCGASRNGGREPPAHAPCRASSIEFRDVRPEKGRYAGPPAPAKTHGSGEFLSDRRESKERRRVHPAAAFEAADVRPARHDSRPCAAHESCRRHAAAAKPARPALAGTAFAGAEASALTHRAALSHGGHAPWSAGSAGRGQSGSAWPRPSWSSLALLVWWAVAAFAGSGQAVRGKRQPGPRRFVGVRPGQPRGPAAGGRQPPGLPAAGLLQGLRPGCAAVHRRGLRHRPLGAAGRRGKVRGR